MSITSVVFIGSKFLELDGQGLDGALNLSDFARKVGVLQIHDGCQVWAHIVAGVLIDNCARSAGRKMNSEWTMFKCRKFAVVG